VEDVLRVSATGAGISYYPEFLARELGYFADERLRVETEAPGHGPWVVRAIDDGRADVVLGGIWRPMMYRGRLATYRTFAQLCDRAAGVLVSRRPVEGFTWSDLLGKSVLLPDGAPSPWMLLRGVLLRAGVDLSGIRFIQDFLASEATDLFRGGLADFYLTGPPTSDLLISQGIAAPAAYMSEAGEMPWSVYYGTPEFVERPDNLAARFTRAIQRALQWTLTHDPSEAPGVFKKHFPTYDPELMAESVRSCRARGVWTSSARVRQSGYERWQEMIIEYGLTDQPIPYDDIVDSRAADWAERE
jgi:NitT/TauT family transport system substrate-binding protein